MAQTIKIIFDVETSDIDKAIKGLDNLSKSIDKAGNASKSLDNIAKSAVDISNAAEIASKSVYKLNTTVNKIKPGGFGNLQQMVFDNIKATQKLDKAFENTGASASKAANESTKAMERAAREKEAIAAKIRAQEHKDFQNKIDEIKKELDAIKKLHNEEEKGTKGTKDLDKPKEIKVGDTKKAAGAIDFIKERLDNAGLSVDDLSRNFAMLASPGGAIVASVLAIGAATAALYKFGDTVREEMKAAENAFGTLVKGNQRDIAILEQKSQALANTFGVEVGRVREALSVSLNVFGGSAEDVKNNIARIYEQLTPEQADEAIERINEYGTQFKKAGFTFAETVNLAINSVNFGVFQDKLMDTVKEFGLSAKNIDDETKNLIANDNELVKLFASIQDGTTSLSEGMEKYLDIREKLIKAGKDTSALDVKLFGAAGEDTGERLNLAKKAIEYQKELKEETKRSLELEEDIAKKRIEAGMEYSKLFKDARTGARELWAELRSNFYDILIKLIPVIKSIREWWNKFAEDFKQRINAIMGSSNGLARIWSLIKAAFRTAWEYIKPTLEALFNAIRRIVLNVFDLVNWVIKLGNQFLGLAAKVGFIKNEWASLDKFVVNSIKGWWMLMKMFGAVAIATFESIATSVTATMEIMKGNFSKGLDMFYQQSKKNFGSIKDIWQDTEFNGRFNVKIEADVTDPTVQSFAKNLLPLTPFVKGKDDVVVPPGDKDSGAGLTPLTPIEPAKETEDKRNRADEEAKKRLQISLAQRQQIIDIAEKKGLMKAEEAAVARTNLEIEHNQDIEKLAAKLISDEPAKWRAREGDEIKEYEKYVFDLFNNRIMAVIDRENQWREDQEKLRDEDLADTQAATASIEALYTDHYDELLKLQGFFNTANEYSSEVSAIKIAQIEHEKYAKLKEVNEQNKQRELNDGKRTKEQIEEINKKYAEKDIELTKATNKAIEDSEINHYMLRKRLLQEFQDEALQSITAFGEKLSSAAGQQTVGGFISTLSGGAISGVTNAMDLNKQRKRREADIDTALSDPNISAGDKKTLQFQKSIGKPTMGIQIATQAIGTLSAASDAYFAGVIAGIDREIAARNKEIDKLKEQAEETKKLREEEEARAETMRQINNRLADERIGELEFLKETVPEAEQEAVDKQIAEEKKKKREKDKIKKAELTEEEKLIKEKEKQNEEAEKRKLALQATQFDIQKAAQIAQTLAAGALAIIMGFAQTGPMGGAVAAGVLAGLTAVQVGIIAAQPNPYRFNKGTLSVPGVGDSDTVNAVLTPGEAVIPKDVNRDYSKSISAIFNRTIPPEVLNAMIHNYTLHNPDMGGMVFINNNTETDKLLERLISTIERKESVSVNIDEDGFDTWVSTQNTRTKYIDKTLRRKI